MLGTNKVVVVELTLGTCTCCTWLCMFLHDYCTLFVFDPHSEGILVLTSRRCRHRQFRTFQSWETGPWGVKFTSNYRMGVISCKALDSVQSCTIFICLNFQNFARTVVFGTGTFSAFICIPPGIDLWLTLKFATKGCRILCKNTWLEIW